MWKGTQTTTDAQGTKAALHIDAQNHTCNRNRSHHQNYEPCDMPPSNHGCYNCKEFNHVVTNCRYDHSFKCRLCSRLGLKAFSYYSYQDQGHGKSAGSTTDPVLEDQARNDTHQEARVQQFTNCIEVRLGTGLKFGFINIQQIHPNMDQIGT